MVLYKGTIHRHYTGRSTFDIETKRVLSIVRLMPGSLAVDCSTNAWLENKKGPSSRSEVN